MRCVLPPCRACSRCPPMRPSLRRRFALQRLAVQTDLRDVRRSRRAVSGVNRRRTTGAGASRVLFWLRREATRSRPAREIAMVAGARGLRGGPSGWWRGWCGRTSPLGSEAVGLVDMAHQPGAEASAATVTMGDWTPLSTPAGAAGRWQRVRMALPGRHSPPAMKLTVGYCRFLILSASSNKPSGLALAGGWLVDGWR